MKMRLRFGSLIKKDVWHVEFFRDLYWNANQVICQLLKMGGKDVFLSGISRRLLSRHSRPSRTAIRSSVSSMILSLRPPPASSNSVLPPDYYLFISAGEQGTSDHWSAMMVFWKNCSQELTTINLLCAYSNDTGQGSQLFQLATHFKKTRRLVIPPKKIIVIVKLYPIYFMHVQFVAY